MLLFGSLIDIATEHTQQAVIMCFGHSDVPIVDMMFKTLLAQLVPVLPFMMEVQR